MRNLEIFFKFMNKRRPFHCFFTLILAFFYSKELAQSVLYYVTQGGIFYLKQISFRIVNFFVTEMKLLFWEYISFRR